MLNFKLLYLDKSRNVANLPDFDQNVSIVKQNCLTEEKKERKKRNENVSEKVIGFQRDPSHFPKLITVL